MIKVLKCSCQPARQKYIKVVIWPLLQFEPNRVFLSNPRMNKNTVTLWLSVLERAKFSIATDRSFHHWASPGTKRSHPFDSQLMDGSCWVIHVLEEVPSTIYFYFKILKLLVDFNQSHELYVNVFDLVIFPAFMAFKQWDDCYVPKPWLVPIRILMNTAILWLFWAC